MFYKDNHSFTFSKGLTEQAKEKPTPYKPFFNYFTSIFTKKSQNSIFRQSPRFFTFISEKRPEFSAHRPKKRPVFSKKC